MHLKLIRHGSIPGVGTFGTLALGEHELKTVEREDLNNLPDVSCIPFGEYHLLPHQSSSKNHSLGGVCYAMVNEDYGVYQYPDPNAIRFACLIHVANFPEELAGCVAPGLQFHRTRWGVSNSTDAMRGIIEMLGKDEHSLTIEWESRL